MTHEIIDQIQKEFNTLKYRYQAELDDIGKEILKQKSTLDFYDESLDTFEFDENKAYFQIQNISEIEKLYRNSNENPYLTALTIFNMWYYQLMIVAFACTVYSKVLKIVHDFSANYKLETELGTIWPPFKSLLALQPIAALHIHHKGYGIEEAIKDFSDLSLKLPPYEIILQQFLYTAAPEEKILKEINIQVTVSSFVSVASYNKLVDISDLAKTIKREYLDKIKEALTI